MENSYTTVLTNKRHSQSSDYSIIIILKDNYGNETIQTFSLNYPNKYTMGRVVENDIHINSSLVSKFHGTFFYENNQLCFCDLNSSNGTIVNNTLYKNSSVYLKDGDTLKIDSMSDSQDNSVLIVVNEGNTNGLAFQVINLDTLQGDLIIGRNIFNSQYENITDGTILNDNNSSNDLRIVLNNSSVSKKHAVIKRMGNMFQLSDLGSTNGIIINGNALRKTTILHDKDTICIGDTKFVYIEKKLYYSTKTHSNYYDDCRNNKVKISVKNITRKVKDDKQNKILALLSNLLPKSKRRYKTILNNVSLDINNSELVAVLGVSGAGKSTLVNCICKHEEKTGGKVLIDGIDVYEEFNTIKSRIGYVPQLDDIHKDLTVEKELKYTAKLRLPSDTSSKEISEKVNKVISIIGLEDNKKTKNSKLSGGQKKRVSIAMELVSDADVFFLDEPTSGLDPETETALIDNLVEMAHSHYKTIMVITHTLQNLNKFDKVVFLAAGGNLCYYGSPDNIYNYFEVENATDIYCKVSSNPKFYIDKYNNEVQNGL